MKQSESNAIKAGTSLVKQEAIQSLIDELLSSEEEITADLTRIIPYVTNEKMKLSMERRLEKGKKCLEALRAGFVPVDAGYFLRTDTKSRWGKSTVKAVLKSMPEDVKEVWEKVKAKGVFDSFSVVSSGGDPMLVGNTGGKHFFIAGWLDFGKGVTLGIRMKL